GTVTAEDARLTLRAALRLETLTSSGITAADADGDGLITAQDARSVLRAALGIGSGAGDPSKDSRNILVNWMVEHGDHVMGGKTYYDYCAPGDRGTLRIEYYTGEFSEHPEDGGVFSFYTLDESGYGVEELFRMFCDEYGLDIDINDLG
ncbi:MAG: hypothetical protein K6C36_04095, partial [Clostridia bacterium]|nr:hypothetical protein [Clostridia bacterium]